MQSHLFIKVCQAVRRSGAQPNRGCRHHRTAPAQHSMAQQAAHLRARDLGGCSVLHEVVQRHAAGAADPSRLERRGQGRQRQQKRGQQAEQGRQRQQKRGQQAEQGRQQQQRGSTSCVRARLCPARPSQKASMHSKCSSSRCSNSWRSSSYIQHPPHHVQDAHVDVVTQRGLGLGALRHLPRRKGSGKLASVEARVA